MADPGEGIQVRITTEMLKGSPIGESLEKIASLLIQQYEDICNDRIGPWDVPEFPAGDEGDVMAWAVATAGHLFRSDVLRRIGLLPQESPPGVVEGTVDGIRPHRPMTTEEDERVRRYAELWEQGYVPTLSRDEEARRIITEAEGGQSDGA